MRTDNDSYTITISAGAQENRKYSPENNSIFYCVAGRFRFNTVITHEKYVNLIKYIKNTYLPGNTAHSC
ncbi:hypothetical protein EAZG_04534 [Escherichia coli TA249]|nr:hypothetical protein EAZG_04534 [Escherichia coli TA249]